MITSQMLLALFRSLLPFAKEAMYGNKELRQLLFANKTATVLAGCLLFVFALLVQTNSHVVESDKKLHITEKHLQDMMIALRTYTPPNVPTSPQFPVIPSLDVVTTPDTPTMDLPTIPIPPIPIDHQLITIAPPPRGVPALKTRIQDRLHSFD